MRARGRNRTGTSAVAIVMAVTGARSMPRSGAARAVMPNSAQAGFIATVSATRMASSSDPPDFTTS